ncbi:DUF3558 domain-containing protein [Nocardia sp. NPDC058705]|uniref:DUF3558 domain-containing protein n=1 Tax=Nocardia sp. NPDC058705 TaxID=3346609 RepID=UPI00369B2811
MRWIPVFAVGLLVSGCGSDGGTGGSATPVATLTPDGLQLSAPTSYNPCVGVSQQILDRFQLRKATDPNSADRDGPGGVRWRGCDWVRSKGYAIGVTTTNITLDYVRANWSRDLREFDIDGRKAVSVRKSDDHPDEVCSINVEMQGGSLEFHLVNPPSARETGHMDTCQLGLEVADAVVPTLPPRA